MFSLIDSIVKAKIEVSPFIHIVVPHALEETAYARLSDAFPPAADFTAGKNRYENFRYNRFASEVLAGDYAPAAKEFARIHASQAFYMAVLDKFRDYYINTLGEAVFESLRDPRNVGLRKVDSFASHDVLLDATFVINSGNRQGNSTVRGPHIDKLFKLYAGLYYMRKPDDASRGGDLVLYRYKRQRYLIGMNDESSTSAGLRYDIDPEHVEPVKVVPYRPNTLVLYPNSVDAIHGVSIRSETDIERRLITLVADYKEDILDVATA